MFRDGGQGWSAGRLATASVAMLLVFLGSMLVLWGIRLALDGAAGTGLVVGTLGATLTFMGGALARGPWTHAHATHARHA
jgi:hypothetical protein